MRKRLKKVIPLLLFTSMVFVAGMYSNGPETSASPVVPYEEKDMSYMEPAPDADTDPIVCEELPILAAEDIPEFEVSRARRVQEVVTLWELYFEDDNAPKNDPRRKDFYLYAEYLMDAVEMYEQNQTDIGGQFPKHKNNHMVIAYTVAKESSVTPDAQGPLGEVCFMQMHGQALAGYDPEKVRHNPKLCLLLGTRWLVSRIPKCPESQDTLESKDILGAGWDNWDWVGPLSLYAGGYRARKKNGECKKFDKMKERVEAMLLYRTRVDHMLRFYNED